MARLLEELLIKLAGVYRWMKAKKTATAEDVQTLRCHLRDLIAYLEANRSGLVNYGARYRRHEFISTGSVDGSINQIIARRMIKKQQMRWNRCGRCSHSSTFASPFLTALWKTRFGKCILSSARRMIARQPPQ